MRYLLGRLASGIVVLFAVSVATFAIAEAAPGDFLSRLEFDAQVSRETIEALRERYGLDRGVVERYMAWLGSVLAGDFGYSMAYEMPVSDLVLGRVGNTLLLTVLASLASWSLALAFGTWAACREGGWPDRLLLGLSALLLAVPQLVLGLGCLFLAARSGLFPLGGMSSHEGTPGFVAGLADLAWHLALPVTALVGGAFPVLFAHVRASLLDTLGAPFLRAARGFGVRPARLLFAYALPGAAKTLVTLLGISIAGLLSGTLVVEIVLSWPGVGRLLIDSVTRRDLHVIVALTFLSALFVVVGQLVADLLLYASDPRIREAS